MTAASNPVFDEQKISLACQEPVIKALVKFAGKPIKEWLLTNRRVSTGQFLSRSDKPCNNYSSLMEEFKEREILDVLAATGPNHCLDGWTFLSRALSALLMGDTHTTRHLAYYAQLRAALSILSCHGIGVFNRVAFVVDCGGEFHHIGTKEESRSGPGTHRAVWKAIRLWANQMETSKRFLDSIKFRGISLQCCVDMIWPSGQGAPVVAKFFEDWGIDLKRSAQDQESRNISSYCAHALNDIKSHPTSRLELIRSIWKSLEPDGTGQLPLDLHLLRVFLRKMREEQKKHTNKQMDWDSVYSELPLQIQSFVSKDFIKSEAKEEDFIVFERARNKDEGDVHAMVCRALLLLRLASAVVRSTLDEAGFGQIDEAGSGQTVGGRYAWLHHLGIERGFWSADESFEEPTELWDEISSAIDKLDELISSRPKEQSNILNNIGDRIIPLGQAERACIWSLAV